MSDISAEQLLRRFLLGSRLYDTMSIENFEAYFSAKYRGKDRVEVLYRLISEKRRDLRLTVNKNIKHQLPTILAKHANASVSNENSDIAAQDADQVMVLLGQRSDDLDREIDNLENVCSTTLADIESAAKLLDSPVLTELLDSEMDIDVLIGLQKTLGK